MNDKRFGKWTPERRAKHAARMALWAADMRDRGVRPSGPATRLRELRAAVKDVVKKMRAGTVVHGPRITEQWARELDKAVNGGEANERR